MNETNRRSDIDMLIAILLLMNYHTAIIFTPFVKFIFFMQNGEPLGWFFKFCSNDCYVRNRFFKEEDAAKILELMRSVIQG